MLDGAMNFNERPERVKTPSSAETSESEALYTKLEQLSLTRSDDVEGAHSAADIDSDRVSEPLPGATDPPRAQSPSGDTSKGKRGASANYTEVVMHVQNSHVGRIIGRGGVRIREIEELTGANVQLSKPNRSDMPLAPTFIRTVKVSGSASQVEHCTRLLQESIVQPNGDLNCRVAFAETRSLYVPCDRIDQLFGDFGRNLRQIEEASGAAIKFAESAIHGDRDAVVTIHGNPEQLARCEDLIYKKIMVDSSGEHPGSAATSTRHLALSAGQAKATVVVHIPHDSVGRVIGKKGMHFKQMQERSGATAHLPKEVVPGCDFREMVITGTQHEIQTCIGFVSTIMAPPGSPPVQLSIIQMEQPAPYEFQHVSYDSVPAQPQKLFTGPQVINPMHASVPMMPMMGGAMYGNSSMMYSGSPMLPGGAPYTPPMYGSPMLGQGAPMYGGPAMLGAMYGGGVPMYGGPAMMPPGVFGAPMHGSAPVEPHGMHFGSPPVVGATLDGSPMLGGSAALSSSLILAVSEAEASVLLGSGLLQRAQYELCVHIELSEMIPAADGTQSSSREIHLTGLPSAVQAGHDRVQEALREMPATSLG